VKIGGLLHHGSRPGRHPPDRGRDPEAPAEHRLLILTGAGIRAATSTASVSTSACRRVARPARASEAARTATSSRRLLAPEGVSYIEHPTIANQLASISPRPAPSWGVPFRRYHHHEFPNSRIPMHRADTGAFLLADALGAAGLTIVEAWMGCIPPTPRDLRARAQLIRETSAADLAKIAGYLPLDHALLEVMATARHVERVQVVTGSCRAGLPPRCVASTSGRSFAPARARPECPRPGPPIRPGAGPESAGRGQAGAAVPDTGRQCGGGLDLIWWVRRCR